MIILNKKVVVVSLLSAFTSVAQASGIAIVEQTGAGLGTAMAGGAAQAFDASVVFTNPAGLANLNGRSLSVSANVLLPRAEYQAGPSTSVVGSTMAGGGVRNVGPKALVPNLYYADATGPIKFGIGISAPYAVHVEYNDSWSGRYFGTEAKFTAVNIAPALAVQLAHSTSVGFALDVQYGSAEFSKAIDFGSLCYGVAPSDFCAGQALYPQMADGYATVSANDWTIGYHLGVQHDLSAATRLGLMYKSETKYRLKGSVAYERVPGMMQSVFQNGPAGAEMTMPDSLSLSLIHQVNPKLSLLADATWTHWDSSKELRIRFANPSPAGDDVTDEDWENTWRFSVGSHYMLNSKWMLKAGLSYDQGPVRDDRRVPMVPDSSRKIVSFGARYSVSDKSTIDAGFSQLRLADAPINQMHLLQGHLVGKYKTTINMVGVQYNQGF